MGAIVEVLTFRLSEGVAESTFLGADHRVQTEAVPNLPGFLRRTTARRADGEWAIITLWGSHQEAEGAETALRAHPASRDLASLMDGATVSVRRYTTLD